MAFAPSPARYPERKADAGDPRFLDLVGAGAKGAAVQLAGVPFDEAVIGRKGCKDGPTAIREAFRFLGSWDPDRDTHLKGHGVQDLGDVVLAKGTVLDAHAEVRKTLAAAFRGEAPLILLGGDNSLSFPHVAALHDARPGSIGLVVLDSHYDLRSYEGQPTSGTPYRRILGELRGAPVKARNLVEVGIRPWANAKGLADAAAAKGVQVVTREEAREWGPRETARYALERAGDGTDHIFLSVDIDALDQAIAPGCSAPAVDGLTYREAAEIVRHVAAVDRCRGMDLVEVAPNLDPTGNTARVAASLVATFVGGVASRQRPLK